MEVAVLLYLKPKKYFSRHNLNSLPNDVKTDKLDIFILSPIRKRTKFCTVKIDGF